VCPLLLVHAATQCLEHARRFLTGVDRIEVDSIRFGHEEDREEQAKERNGRAGVEDNRHSCGSDEVRQPGHSNDRADLPGSSGDAVRRRILAGKASPGMM